MHAARRAANAVHAVFTVHTHTHTVAMHVAGARMALHADLCAVGCKANRLVTVECTCDGQYGSFALYQRGNMRVGQLYLAVYSNTLHSE